MRFLGQAPQVRLPRIPRIELASVNLALPWPGLCNLGPEPDRTPPHEHLHPRGQLRARRPRFITGAPRGDSLGRPTFGARNRNPWRWSRIGCRGNPLRHPSHPCRVGRMGCRAEGRPGRVLLPLEPARMDGTGWQRIRSGPSASSALRKPRRRGCPLRHGPARQADGHHVARGPLDT